MPGSWRRHPAGSSSPEHARSPLASDVRAGLARAPRRLSSRYLYDDLGSALFETICHLPWYRITRAESALLDRHAGEIAARSGPAPFVVELGPGSGDKLRRLGTAFAACGRAVHLHLVDISSGALASARRALSDLDGVSITADHATYEAGLARVDRVRPPGLSMLTLLLGSNIGNYERDEAVALLRRIRTAGRRGDWLLLGADLVKPEADLLLAYDDPLGVTAAFNKNLLFRMNTELGADFDLSSFDHVARWNAEHARVEMHLVSRSLQRVQIPGAGLTLRFEAGETIWTESSCKYTPASLAALTAEAGFALNAHWTDHEAGFALALFQASDDRR